ncbi:MAG: glycosyltransferase [Alphaproteobacteria bacterium]|nr:glycosyltransferase [Alphaproteobacteria bacterium]MBN2674879.1 glycosyltransferase [Alphaproteobacteria bacterium]
MKPELSIIIPVYNGEKYVSECLNSILNQNRIEDFEIIIINDGSTDNSVKKISEFSRKHYNIFLHSQNNKGVSRARNMGIKVSNGKYLTFIDIDDKVGVSYESIANIFKSDFAISKETNGLKISKRSFDERNEINYSFDKDYFIKMLNITKNEAPDVAFAGKFTINHDEQYTKQHVYKEDAFFGNSAKEKEILLGHADLRENANFALYKRNFLEKNNLLFQEGMNLDEDMLFCMLAVLFSDKSATISGATYLYNRHSNTLSNFSKERERNYKYTIANIQRYSAFLNLISESERYDNLFNTWIKEFAISGIRATEPQYFPNMCFMCSSQTCNDCYKKEVVVRKIKNNIKKFLPNYLFKGIKTK